MSATWHVTGIEESPSLHGRELKGQVGTGPGRRKGVCLLTSNARHTHKLHLDSPPNASPRGCSCFWLGKPGRVTGSFSSPVLTGLAVPVTAAQGK